MEALSLVSYAYMGASLLLTACALPLDEEM